jgi:gamma-glutamylcyclotransferase (GGCT)/AIG2-like uncharacterized protein YtfP
MKMCKLFSYGTLQDEAVQLQTFGRKLLGAKDSLVGYKIELIEIVDPEIIKLSGKKYHPNLVLFADGKVSGMVFEVTEEEIKQCDDYEKQYERSLVKLESGAEAFIYMEKGSV